MKDLIKFRRNLGIISSSVGGFMSVIGLGILLHWQIAEVPLRVSVIAYIVVMLLAFPAWFLVRNLNFLSVILGGLLVSLAGAVPIVFLGVEFMDIPVIQGIPDWPRWAGILLVILGPLIIVFWILYFYDYAEMLFNADFETLTPHHFREYTNP